MPVTSQNASGAIGTSTGSAILPLVNDYPEGLHDWVVNYRDSSVTTIGDIDGVDAFVKTLIGTFGEDDIDSIHVFNAAGVGFDSQGDVIGVRGAQKFRGHGNVTFAQGGAFAGFNSAVWLSDLGSFYQTDKTVFAMVHIGLDQANIGTGMCMAEGIITTTGWTALRPVSGNLYQHYGSGGATFDQLSQWMNGTFDQEFSSHSLVTYGISGASARVVTVTDQTADQAGDIQHSALLNRTAALPNEIFSLLQHYTDGSGNAEGNKQCDLAVTGIVVVNGSANDTPANREAVYTAWKDFGVRRGGAAVFGGNSTLDANYKRGFPLYAMGGACNANNRILGQPVQSHWDPATENALSIQALNAYGWPMVAFVNQLGSNDISNTGTNQTIIDALRVSKPDPSTWVWADVSGMDFSATDTLVDNIEGYAAANDLKPVYYWYHLHGSSSGFYRDANENAISYAGELFLKNKLGSQAYRIAAGVNDHVRDPGGSNYEPYAAALADVDHYGPRGQRHIQAAVFTALQSARLGKQAWSEHVTFADDTIGPLTAEGQVTGSVQTGNIDPGIAVEPTTTAAGRYLYVGPSDHADNRFGWWHLDLPDPSAAYFVGLGHFYRSVTGGTERDGQPTVSLWGRRADNGGYELVWNGNPREFGASDGWQNWNRAFMPPGYNRLTLQVRRAPNTIDFAGTAHLAITDLLVVEAAEAPAVAPLVLPRTTTFEAVRKSSNATAGFAQATEGWTLGVIHGERECGAIDDNATSWGPQDGYNGSDRWMNLTRRSANGLCDFTCGRLPAGSTVTVRYNNRGGGSRITEFSLRSLREVTGNLTWDTVATWNGSDVSSSGTDWSLTLPATLPANATNLSLWFSCNNTTLFGLGEIVVTA